MWSKKKNIEKIAVTCVELICVKILYSNESAMWHKNVKYNNNPAKLCKLWNVNRYQMIHVIIIEFKLIGKIIPHYETIEFIEFQLLYEYVIFIF